MMLVCRSWRYATASALILFCSGFVVAHEAGVEEIEVVGRKTDIVGEAVSASQGIIGQQELRVRPLLRTGEILETVPIPHTNLFRRKPDGGPARIRLHGEEW